MEYDYAEFGFTEGDTRMFEPRHLFGGKDIGSMGDIYPDSNELLDVLFKNVKRGKQRIIRRHRLNTARTLLFNFLEIVMERVAKGDTFVLPSGDKIYARAIPQDIVKKLRQEGHFKDIDIIKANYQIPEVVYQFKKGVIRLIYMPKRYREMLYRNLENGVFALPNVITKI